jgi:hypothetical protein
MRLASWRVGEARQSALQIAPCHRLQRARISTFSVTVDD